MRKVLYVTGTRADFGLMASTLQQIAAHPELQLQVAVTGMHLSPSYGLTVRDIEALGVARSWRGSPSMWKTAHPAPWRWASVRP